MALLETQKLTKTFIGLKAVTNMDLSVNKGQILGLIGPNGAGKTTLFNLISGALPPTSGKVIYKDKDITGFKPHILHGWVSCALSSWPLFSRIYRCWIIFRLRFITNPGWAFYRHCLKTPAMERKQNALVREKAMKLLNIAGLTNIGRHAGREPPWRFPRN